MTIFAHVIESTDSLPQGSRHGELLLERDTLIVRRWMGADADWEAVGKSDIGLPMGAVGVDGVMPFLAVTSPTDAADHRYESSTGMVKCRLHNPDATNIVYVGWSYSTGAFTAVNTNLGNLNTAYATPDGVKYTNALVLQPGETIEKYFGARVKYMLFLADGGAGFTITMEPLE